MSQTRGIDRREFVKAAVAIGGASALSACLNRNEVDAPGGPEDLSSLPDRQHAWNDALDSDDAGNPSHPRHQVLLALDYGDGTPTDDERETVEAALRGLERAYARANGGLFVSLGYSPYYFQRFEASLPEGVDLPEPTALASFENPAADDVDALLHLASDHGQVVLGAEEALKGEQSTLNGADQPETPLSDVFEVVERRTGFIGAGLPAENQDVSGVPDGDHVPEEAPLYMGFKSGFKGNQATEDRVTIESGPFAGGTTQHLSKISLNLQQWYTQDSRDQRVTKMFCPAHAQQDAVEGVGENLGTQTESDLYGDPVEGGRRLGVVGHAQKMVPTRDEDERPLILRRDFDSTDDGQAGVHFLSLQRRVEQFVATREAMNGEDVADQSAVGQRTNNGILQYMNVERRGNFLLPPRSLRALPTPNPDGASD